MQTVPDVSVYLFLLPCPESLFSCRLLANLARLGLFCYFDDTFSLLFGFAEKVHIVCVFQVFWKTGACAFFDNHVCVRWYKFLRLH